MSDQFNSEFTEPTPSYLYKMDQKWSIDRTAFDALKLKPADLEDPNKRKFVEVTNIAHNLWENFSHAADTQPGGRYLYGMQGVSRPGMPINDLQPILGRLYGKADNLSGEAVEILTDGFGGHSLGSWTEYQIGTVVEDYGLQVKPAEEVTSSESETADTNVLLETEDDDFDNPSVMYERVATRLGIPRDKWQDPTYYQLIGLLVGVDKLRAESRKAIDQPPALSPSEGPAITERYKAVSFIMGATKGIFEAEIKGDKVSAEFLKETLGKGLAVYNLQLVEKTDSNS